MHAAHRSRTALSTLIGTLVLAASSSSTFAAVITRWDFNMAVAKNNSPTPSSGVGNATPVGMTDNANDADIIAISAAFPSADPVKPGTGWRVRGSVANGYSGSVSLLSGAKFSVSTVGHDDVVVSFDLHATDGSPRHAQFQYTTDGTTFASFGNLIDNNPTFDRYVTYTYDLSSLANVAENPNFAFKLVSAFSPVEFTNANGLQPANTAFQRSSATPQVYNGTAGNYRFDYVTISGNVVPEPASLALVGLALSVATRRRR